MLKRDFDNHGIWGSIKNAEEAINNAYSGHPDDESAIAQKKQIEYARWVLEQSNGNLVGKQELDQANNHMVSIAQHAQKLGYYLNHVDPQFGQFFAIFPYPRIKKIFKSETNRVVEEFTATVTELRQETSAISAEIKAARDEVENSTQQLEDELTKVQSKALSYESLIVQKQSDFDASASSMITEKMSEFTERFSTAQSERSEKFQKTLDDISASLRKTEDDRQKLNAEYEESLQNAAKILETKRNEFEKIAQDTLTKLDGFYDKAGQDALAADFAGNAASEDKQFRRFSKIAAFCFIVSAGVLGYMWYSLSKDADFQFTELLKRVPVSVVFLLPGFYFASLASGHRKSAIKLRSLGLRIRSFGAYVTPAEKEEQVKLRAEMVKEFFAEEKNDPQKRGLFDRNVGKSVESVVGLAEKAIDKIPKG